MANILDILINATERGVDFVQKGSDYATTETWENMVFYALFGGNIQESTDTKERIENKQYFDWWANKAFDNDNPDVWMNSKTERTLNSVALSSSGLTKIQNAVSHDLSFFRPFADIDVTVSRIDVDKIEIFIIISEPNNITRKEFRFIWDAALQGLDLPVDADEEFPPAISPVTAAFISAVDETVETVAFTQGDLGVTILASEFPAEISFSVNASGELIADGNQADAFGIAADGNLTFTS